MHAIEMAQSLDVQSCGCPHVHIILTDQTGKPLSYSMTADDADKLVAAIAEAQTACRATSAARLRH